MEHKEYHSENDSLDDPHKVLLSSRVYRDTKGKLRDQLTS